MTILNDINRNIKHINTLLKLLILFVTNNISLEYVQVNDERCGTKNFYFQSCNI